MSTLKESYIACCGGYLGESYWIFLDKPLWEIIEAIELTKKHWQRDK